MNTNRERNKISTIVKYEKENNKKKKQNKRQKTKKAKNPDERNRKSYSRWTWNRFQYQDQDYNRNEIISTERNLVNRSKKRNKYGPPTLPSELC